MELLRATMCSAVKYAGRIL